jgi:hypothetical protein
LNVARASNKTVVVADYIIYWVRLRTYLDWHYANPDKQ